MQVFLPAAIAVINCNFFASLQSAGKCVPFASAGCNQLSPGILICCSLVVFNDSLEMLRQHTDVDDHKGAMTFVD